MSNREQDITTTFEITAPKLVVQKGESFPKTPIYILTKQYILGRSLSKKDLELQDRTSINISNETEIINFTSMVVSHQHCLISKITSYRGISLHQIVDLDSTNGTYVDGIPLGDNVKILKDKSIIQLSRLGDTVILKYEADWPVPDIIQMEESTRTVSIFGNPTESFTPKEFSIFQLLYDKSPEVVSSDDIANTAWPELDGSVSPAQIQTMIRKIRVKLSESCSDAIVTVQSIGYRFNSDFK